MSRSKESFSKKEVRNKQLKKRKDKEKRRLERKDPDKKNSFDDMMAWVDEKGTIHNSPPELSDKTEIKAEDIEISVPKGGIVKEPLNYKGEISNFDESKGFGFIHCERLRGRVFVHINDCPDKLKTGQKVEFGIEKGVKGIKAIDVKLIQ